MNRKHAVIRQVSGLTFTGKGDSGHWVVMDAPPSVGGNGAGSSPKELLMLSLAGCTGSDVVSILTKKRVPYTSLEVHVTGETRDEHPQVFVNLHIEYVVYGSGINPKDVERSIELSETKYCAVSAMLKEAVTITRSLRIEESAGPATPPENGTRKQVTS